MKPDSPARDACMTCSSPGKRSPPENTKAGVRAWEIDYGYHPSPFGECLLAVTLARHLRAGVHSKPATAPRRCGS